MPYTKGDIVEINFPYTDLSKYKKRPALIISDQLGINYIFMQITSNTKNSPYRLPIDNNTDFTTGKLYLRSVVHLDILFTGEDSLIKNYYGKLTSSKLTEILGRFKTLF